jgi:hypothetical protein
MPSLLSVRRLRLLEPTGRTESGEGGAKVYYDGIEVSALEGVGGSTLRIRVGDTALLHNAWGRTLVGLVAAIYGVGNELKPFVTTRWFFRGSEVKISTMRGSKSVRVGQISRTRARDVNPRVRAE